MNLLAVSGLILIALVLRLVLITVLRLILAVSILAILVALVILGLISLLVHHQYLLRDYRVFMASPILYRNRRL